MTKKNFTYLAFDIVFGLLFSKGNGRSQNARFLILILPSIPNAL